MTGFLDLIGVPSSWHPCLVGIAAMLTLAGLDFAGSIFAKEWAERHHTGLFLAGLACFVVLYTVYAKVLEVAELSVVTLGWIVFLQVGLLLVDQLIYGVALPPGKWAAAGVILVLQAYLLLAPNGNPQSPEPQSSTSPADSAAAPNLVGAPAGALASHIPFVQ